MKIWNEEKDMREIEVLLLIVIWLPILMALGLKLAIGIKYTH